MTRTGMRPARGLRAGVAALIVGCLGVMGTSAASVASPTTAAAEPPATNYVATSGLVEVLDTTTGVGAARRPIGSGSTVTVPVAGRAGVPAAGATAVALDVRIENLRGSCYLTVYSAGAARPAVSTTFSDVSTPVTANLVVALLAKDPRVGFFVGCVGSSLPNQGMDVIATVAGYYRDSAAAGAFVPVAPARMMSTGSGLGVPHARIPSNAMVTFPVAGRAGIPLQASAVLLNVTSVRPAAAGSLTVWASGTARPSTPQLSYPVGATRPSAFVLSTIGADGSLSLRNASAGSTDVTADVAGYVVGPIGSGRPEVTDLPLPSNAHPDLPTSLSSIVCPAAGSCVAVGSYTGDDPSIAERVVPTPLVETLSGGAWAAISPPTPVGVAGYLGARLSAVACASPTTCLATATWGDASEDPDFGTYLVTLRNGVWSTLLPALPAGADPTEKVTLTAAACPSASTCVAVGYSATLDRPTGSTGPIRGLIETVSGGVVTAIRPPAPPGAEATATSSLRGISCGGPGRCVSVGGYGPDNLLESLSGGTWTASAVPLPSGTGPTSSGNLRDVSCASPTFCAANGATYGPGHGGELVTVNGSVANSTRAFPADSAETGYSEYAATGLSCSAPSSCTAVGYYQTLTSDFRPMRAVLANGTWTFEQAPLPSGAPDAELGLLRTVSCRGADSCVAAGYRMSRGSDREALLDSWSGRSTTSDVIPGMGDLYAVASSGPHSWVLVGDNTKAVTLVR